MSNHSPTKYLLNNPPLQQKNARIESLDFLRGIAAGAVMLFHYTADSSIQLSSANLLRRIGAYGHFGVEVFFILSGFVIAYSMYSNSYRIHLIGKFLIKRALRIEIPFLVIIAVEVFLIFVSSLTPWKNGVSERLDAYNIMLHMGYLNGLLGRPWLIPVFWTLAIEFQFYLLMAVLFPLFSHVKLAYRIPTMAGFAVLNFVFPQVNLFFSHCLFFLMGILVFQLKVGIIKFHEFLIVSVGLLFLLYFQREPILLLIAVITVTVILFLKLDWKWSAFLGTISYSIYLVHVPFGGRLLMLTQMYGPSDETKSVLIGIYFSFTVFVAWIFYLLVERPSLRLSRKVVYKNGS